MDRSSPDLAFRALADSYRRRLLVALLEENSQAEIPSLDVVDVGDSPPEILRLEIHHQHLPLLEDLGIITWNRTDHTVSEGPNFDEIRPLVELIDEHRDELPDDWF